MVVESHAASLSFEVAQTACGAVAADVESDAVIDSGDSRYGSGIRCGELGYAHDLVAPPSVREVDRLPILTHPVLRQLSVRGHVLAQPKLLPRALEHQRLDGQDSRLASHRRGDLVEELTVRIDGGATE